MPVPSGPLICDPNVIFDVAAVRAQIDAAAAEGAEPAALRNEAISEVRRYPSEQGEKPVSGYRIDILAGRNEVSAFFTAEHRKYWLQRT